MNAEQDTLRSSVTRYEREIAENGNVEAMFNLANLFLNCEDEVRTWHG